MSSNEHPDMSGNPSDAPYVCEKCGTAFTDDAKLSGSFFSTETILCSQECSVEYDYAIAERLTARVEELERKSDRIQKLFGKTVLEKQAASAENARLTARAAELDNWLSMRTKRVMESEIAADNARLRELLRQCAQHLPQLSQLYVDVRKELSK